MRGESGIPPLVSSPASPFSWRSDLVSLTALTLLVLALQWATLDGSHTLMCDLWRFTYPWAREGGVTGEGFIESGAEHTSALIFDIQRQSFPWFSFAQSELAEGRWPHWNPYSFCGAPLYANHLVPLTHLPLALALIVAPVQQIFTVASFFTLWFGGLGLYLYLRYRRLHPAAAFVSATLYLTCGHYMPLVPFQMFGVMYYPWLLWASDALEYRPSLTRVALFSLVLGLFLAAGHPGFIAPFLYLLAVHRVLNWIFARRSLRWWMPRVGMLCAILVLGFLVSSVQNLPSRQLLGLSSREASQVPGELPWNPEPDAAASARGHYAPPATTPTEPRPSRAATVLAPVFYHCIELEHPYVGFPLLLLALVGFLRFRPPPERTSFIILTLLFAGLAIPRLFYAIAPLIPGLELAPYVPFAQAQFLLAVAAGVGAHHLMGPPDPQDTAPRWIFSFLSLVSAFALLALFVPSAILRPDTWWENRQVSLAAAVLVTTLLALVLPALTWWFGVRRAWLGGIALPLILALAGIVGHLYQYPIYQPVPVMPVTRSIAALPRNPAYRLARHTSWLRHHAPSADHPWWFGGNLAMWAGCLDAQGYDSFILERHAQVLKALDRPSLARDRMALPLKDPRALTSPLLDAMAVGYIISDDPDLLLKPDSGAPADEWTLVHTGGLNIYRRDHALPRWYLAERATLVDDLNEAVAVMQETSILTGSAPGVVLERSEGLKVPDPLLDKVGFRSGGSPGAVSLVEENPQCLEFAVDAPQDTFLVLADAWHPEWHAFVDGREVPIHVANGAYRAVYLPSGDHLVVFRYIPGAFHVGLLISLATLMALFAGSVVELRRKGQRGV